MTPVRCIGCGRLLVGDPSALRDGAVCFDCAEKTGQLARERREKINDQVADRLRAINDMLLAQGKIS